MGDRMCLKLGVANASDLKMGLAKQSTIYIYPPHDPRTVRVYIVVTPYGVRSGCV